MYEIPRDYYLRLHHPRPRFKTDIENVIIYIATEIVGIGRRPEADFVVMLNNAIRRYAGNGQRKAKTVDNWRTEIDALFGFIQKQGTCLSPTLRATELADRQDLVRFMKLFCYHFQYPGGFVKPERNLEVLKARVNFRPACYITQLLQHAEETTGKRQGISKAEATHCLFNDLRVTRDARPVAETWALIERNRRSRIAYDMRGDVIRYAGDVLDYMGQANLLSYKANYHYYLNHRESLALERFANPEQGFDYYALLPSISNVTIDDVSALEYDWVEYVNTPKPEDFFDTDIIALLSETDEDYEQLRNTIQTLQELIEGDVATSKEVGDLGESMVVSHEIRRLIALGREDLKHLVKKIPTALAVGYDVQSCERDATKRLIEVKTTASSTSINFTRIHMTPNEWAAATSFKERYFIYRLMISKGSKRLFVMQDPVCLFKKDRLVAIPRDGMDIIFNPDVCGTEVELLAWE